MAAVGLEEFGVPGAPGERGPPGLPVPGTCRCLPLPGQLVVSSCRSGSCSSYTGTLRDIFHPPLPLPSPRGGRCQPWLGIHHPKGHAGIWSREPGKVCRLCTFSRSLNHYSALCVCEVIAVLDNGWELELNLCLICLPTQTNLWFYNSVELGFLKSMYEESQDKSEAY